MNDPYVYPGTEVLINKLNIMDVEELAIVENKLTLARMKLIREKNLVKGNYNYEHLKAYHKYIFQDIYEWAGEQRTVNIEKSELVLNGLLFKHSNVENIEVEITNSLNRLNDVNWGIASLEEKVDKFTVALSDVWKAHAFREGNTRTTITFFMQYAKEHGFPLNDKLISDNIKYVRDSLVASSYEDKEIGISRNFTYLNRIIRDSLESYEHQAFHRKTLEDIKEDINKNKTNKHNSFANKNENINNKKASDKER